MKVINTEWQRHVQIITYANPVRPHSFVFFNMSHLRPQPWWHWSESFIVQMQTKICVGVFLQVFLFIRHHIKYWDFVQGWTILEWDNLWKTFALSWKVSHSPASFTALILIWSLNRFFVTATKKRVAKIKHFACENDISYIK